MKIVVVFLCLCGAMLSVDAACSLLGCTLGMDILGSSGCSTYNTYITCLNGELEGCTNSTAHGVARSAIDAAITSSTAARNLLNCNGASGASFSLFSLLLPLIVAFFKL